ncbi:Gfo/Idh/MocA family protein, partial [Klebsiella oxytoca]|uniref:Gfo/Idh/MocA family protein n=4 Tax=Klebsiella/Raoultella group TaxID=2890311 RepID=UPI0006696382
MNVCMVGYGMMGTWHSESLRKQDCVLHTLVGPDTQKAEAFALKYGYRHWHVDYKKAFNDPQIDVVIIAGPSQSHAEMALAALHYGKHVLVEIPLALTLEDCEAIDATAARLGLTVGVVHPMRFRKKHIALCERLRSGEEKLLQVHSRLYLHRRENTGSTGLKRSWTDNLLWHHGAHLIDVALWLVGAGDTAEAEKKLAGFKAVLPDADETTGIPMEFSLLAETCDHKALMCSGSYNSQERIFDIRVLTDKANYHLDILSGTLSVNGDIQIIESEERNNALVSEDFISSLKEGREPKVSAKSVMPAMRLIYTINLKMHFSASG